MLLRWFRRFFRWGGERQQLAKGYNLSYTSCAPNKRKVNYVYIYISPTYAPPPKQDPIGYLMLKFYKFLNSSPWNNYA